MIAFLFSPFPPPTLPFCTTCSYPLKVARREAHRVCMFAHVSPSCTTETPSREWQASFGLPTFPLPLLPPVDFSTRSVPKRPADDQRRRQRLSVVETETANAMICPEESCRPGVV